MKNPFIYMLLYTFLCLHMLVGIGGIIESLNPRITNECNTPNTRWHYLFPTAKWGCSLGKYMNQPINGDK